MKVLFVSNDPSIFDEGSAARARMRAYADAIGELHILSPAPRAAREADEVALRLHAVRGIKLLRVFTLAWHARALIKEHGIEVVSAQDPFELGLAALLATRGKNAVLHLQVHTDFASPWFTRCGHRRMSLLNRCRRAIADVVLPRAGGIRVVSDRIRKSLVARYGHRISAPVVLPVAVADVVPQSVPLPPHAFTFALIAVGRLEPEKRLEDVLQALVLLRSRYPVIGLFIVGAGRERARLQKRVRKLNLEQCVVFLGSRPDAWALMQSAQCFIQASAYEGYGRTLIEAALARVPIITTDAGIVGDVLVPGRDVLVAPVAHPEVLALHIKALIEDNSKRISLTERAEMAARKHLDFAGDLPQRIAADLAHLH